MFASWRPLKTPSPSSPVPRRRRGVEKGEADIVESGDSDGAASRVGLGRGGEQQGLRTSVF